MAFRLQTSDFRLQTSHFRLANDLDCQRRERAGFLTARDNGEAWTSDREDERGRARMRDGDVRAHAVRRRLAAQLVADRLRRPQQTLEPADVDRHEIAVVQLVARRELLRDLRERA